MSRPEWARYSMAMADPDRNLWDMLDGERVVLRSVSVPATELFYRLIEEGAAEQEAAAMTRAAERKRREAA